MSEDYALEALYWLMGNSGLDLCGSMEDEYLAKTMLTSTPAKLQDLAGVFLRSQRIYADEKSTYGPPKYAYKEGDAFGDYVRNGCPNCSQPFRLQYDTDLPGRKVKALVCKTCGHSPCPSKESILWKCACTCVCVCV